MTEEYKNKLFKWLIGQYEIEQGENKQTFSPPSDINNGFYTEFIENVGSNFEIIETIQAGDYNAIYGNTTDDEQGFIYIVDNEFNYIVNYRTSYLEKLREDENGEYYAIVKIGSTRYLDLLNNFVLETPTYPRTLVVKQSYTLNTFVNSMRDIVDIQKNPSSAQYVILGQKLAPPEVPTFLNPFISNITINADNQLEYEEFNEDLPPLTINIQTMNIVWGNEIKVYMSGIGTFQDIPVNQAFEICETDYATKTIIRTYWTPVFNTNANAKSITIGNISYYVYYDDYEKIDEDKFLRFYKVENNTSTEIFSIYTSTFLNFEFRLVNDEVYFSYQENDEMTPDRRYFTYGRINDNEVIVSDPIQYSSGIINISLFNITKQNNLYTINQQIDNLLYKVQSIYNENNYNGECYQDLTSLNPNSIKLFNDKNEVLFAKNSSSVLVQGNVTTSSFQIPNTLANDVSIVKEQLLGKTNCILTEKNDMFTKNIFEELIFNFINSINMINNNNVNSPILNFNGANRINLSTSKENDYNSAKMTKYRLNYANSNVVIMLPTPTINGLVANYKIALYNNNIISVDFISDDETTTYLTIDMSSYVINKLYAINQDMEVV